MAIQDNPSKYIGRNVKLNRGGKIVEVYLYAVGKGPHFKGTWVGPDEKPWQTIVPFAELDGMFIEK
jgi:hypothetical protein